MIHLVPHGGRDPPARILGWFYLRHICRPLCRSGRPLVRRARFLPRSRAKERREWVSLPTPHFLRYFEACPLYIGFSKIFLIFSGEKSRKCFLCLKLCPTLCTSPPTDDFSVWRFPRVIYGTIFSADWAHPGCLFCVQHLFPLHSSCGGPSLPVWTDTFHHRVLSAFHRSEDSDTLFRFPLRRPPGICNRCIPHTDYPYRSLLST